MALLRDMITSLLFVAAAMILQMISISLFPGIGVLLLYLSIILSAYRSGLRGALFATFFAILAGIYIYSPEHNFIDFFKNKSSAASVVIFTIEGFLIGIISERMKRRDEERSAIEKRKDNFMNMASHEFKTPITSMKAFTELRLREVQKNNDVKGIEHNKRMLKDLNRLTGLINNMLDISRFGAKKLILDPTIFDLNQLILECIEEISVTNKTHKIVYTETPIMLNADRYRIEQVITNLISNAIKYSPDAKEVVVSCRTEKKYVTFSVQDFGIGIPSNVKDKIFDRFYRTRNADKNYPGLGLGLFISREIVRAHGGDIWYKTRAGKGTTFYVKLALEHEKNTHHRR